MKLNHLVWISDLIKEGRDFPPFICTFYKTLFTEQWSRLPGIIMFFPPLMLIADAHRNWVVHQACIKLFDQQRTFYALICMVCCHNLLYNWFLILLPFMCHEFNFQSVLSSLNRTFTEKKLIINLLSCLWLQNHLSILLCIKIELIFHNPYNVS